MKKAIFIITALIFFVAVSAQDDKTISSGKIVYEDIAKLNIQLDGDASQFADMLPKERKSKKVLYFNSDASLYENDNSDEEDISEEMDTGHGMMMIRMMEPENKFYIDLKKGKKIEQREFMTRVFLIENKLEESDWKITGNQKTILDYACQEATRENEAKKIESVWFAPSIPVSSGPGEYTNLPGLVLEVNIDNGERMVRAISVNTDPIDEKLLIKPKKGKKVSSEEFKKIVEEKMKEMGSEEVEGNVHMNVIIRD